MNPYALIEHLYTSAKINQALNLLLVNELVFFYMFNYINYLYKYILFQI